VPHWTALIYAIEIVPNNITSIIFHDPCIHFSFHAAVNASPLKHQETSNKHITVHAVNCTENLLSSSADKFVKYLGGCWLLGPDTNLFLERQ
jgi:hypothetical protein